MTQRQLFIVHEATRSGAPILVLTFLRGLKQRQGAVSFDVLLLRDGPLRAEFEALCPTFVAERVSGRLSLAGRMTTKAFRRDPSYWMQMGVRWLVARKYQIVYGNSIVCLPWLYESKRLGQARCVCAVHELTLVIDECFKRPFVTDALEALDAVVAGSQTVADNLIATYSISASRLHVVHAFVDRDVPLVKSKAELRQQLGIADDRVVVIGGVGTPELRKGTDLVVPLALCLRRRFPGFKFRLVWLGGHHDDLMIRFFSSDATKAGVSDCVNFVDATPRANDYINLFDVFVLLSREDPFPLVALTAATLAKPIVAFEQGGGMVELLQGGGGALVPFLDIDTYADRVHELATDRALADTAGHTVAQRLKEDFDPESEWNKLWIAIRGTA